MTPLLYRGLLEDGGAPVNDVRMFGASPWPDATTTAEAVRLCNVSPSAVAVTNGRFELALDACVAAVRTSRDPWLQVTVGGVDLPRTKLGAVPYAIEASYASSATGSLQTQLTQMQAQLTTLTTQNAALLARVGAAESRDADCPRGYGPPATPDPTFVGEQRLCVRGADQVVRVGTGNEAFWIDRYEASVWQNADGTGAQYGVGVEYPMGFPRNGQWTTRVYALSKPGVRPSADITWFQANEACRASGKRLPTGDEWLAAARNTPDNVTNCRIEQGALSNRSRDTNSGTGCRSSWGAEDNGGQRLGVDRGVVRRRGKRNRPAHPQRDEHRRLARGLWRRRHLEHRIVGGSRRRSSTLRNPFRSVPRRLLGRRALGPGCIPCPWTAAPRPGPPAWASAAFCGGSGYVASSTDSSSKSNTASRSISTPLKGSAATRSPGPATRTTR